jgi:hypothetical protein
MVERPLAFWCRIPSRPNFGDALAPWLIRRIAGVWPGFARPEDPRPKYFVTGSILAMSAARCRIWGAGILHRDDPVSPEAEWLAVRGPLSRDRARACGAECPEIYGDPALLLPRLYRPTPTARTALGVVAHFSDRHRIAWPEDPQIRMIDIQDPIADVVDAIVACDRIVSSSLHGLIVAHAYGVPASWGRFHPLPSGDDSKFDDFHLSIGLDPPPAPLALAYDRADAARRESAPMRGAGLDVEPLWRCCPFRTGEQA